MPGFYERHVAPHLINCLCGIGQIAAQRAEIVPQAEGVVLEIGIGSGHNLKHYDPDRVKRVIGVEPSQGFRKIGEERFSGASVDVEVIDGVAEDIPLEAGSADTAVVTYTLCSVDDALKALAEIRRVLKPSGRVLVLEHGRSDETSVARWQDRLNPVWKPVAAGCNINRPIARLFEQTGFEFLQLDRFNLSGTPRVVGHHYRGVARLK